MQAASSSHSSPRDREAGGRASRGPGAPISPAPVSLGQVDTRSLLDRMGALRREAARVQRHLHVGSIPHSRLALLLEDIDDNAMLITGDRRHFAADPIRVCGS